MWSMPAEPAATDAEIATTAARWGLNGRAPGSAHRKAIATHVHQSLRHGRSNVVAVEIKHSGRGWDAPKAMPSRNPSSRNMRMEIEGAAKDSQMPA